MTDKRTAVASLSLLYCWLANYGRFYEFGDGRRHVLGAAVSSFLLEKKMKVYLELLIDAIMSDLAQQQPHTSSRHVWLFQVKRCSVIKTTTSINCYICMQIGRRLSHHRVVNDC